MYEFIYLFFSSALKSNLVVGQNRCERTYADTQTHTIYKIYNANFDGGKTKSSQSDFFFHAFGSTGGGGLKLSISRNSNSLTREKKICTEHNFASGFIWISRARCSHWMGWSCHASFFFFFFFEISQADRPPFFFSPCLFAADFLFFCKLLLLTHFMCRSVGRVSRNCAQKSKTPSIFSIKFFQHVVWNGTVNCNENDKSDHFFLSFFRNLFINLNWSARIHGVRGDGPNLN